MTDLSETVASEGPLPVDEVPGHLDVSDKMAGTAKFRVTGAQGDGLKPGNTSAVYYDVHTHADADVLEAFLGANSQLRDRLSPRSLLHALTRGAGLDRDVVGDRLREFFGEEKWSESFSNHGATPSGTSLSTHLAECDSASEALDAHEEANEGDADEAA